MLTFSFDWRLLVGVTLTYYATLVFYRLFLHPLARYPGPRLAAISRWYEAYYDVVLNGKYTTKIAELHKIYGPIIRISPHELHVIDPEFFDTLYRTDGIWHKYAWAYDAFGAQSSTIFGSDHHEHKAHRRAIAPLFSKTTVFAREPILRHNISKLCERISHFDGKPFNLGAALSACTRDVANEYVVGKTYNELDLDDFGIGLSIASQGAGVFWRTTKHIRWFGPLLRAMPISWAMQTSDEGTKSFLGYMQQSEQDTRDTIAIVASSSPNEQDNSTIVHTIMHSNLPSSEKSFNRIFEEVVSVTGAAFETTASVLRLTIYHIYANPKILKNLRRELTTVGSDYSLRQLEHLSYLTAVLKEGMRLSPAISTRAARITDKDLFYKEWRIPAGTPVGMTTILMHTDEAVYPDPLRFDPERWLASKTGGTSTLGYAPFSKGTRVCIGLHLAWAEMYLLLAAVIPNFTFAIEGAKAEDFKLETDNFGIGTKAGCNLMVRQV